MAKITVGFLNKKIENIHKEFDDEGVDYTAITDLHMVQEEYAGYIKPYNVKGAGTFRSLSELNQYRQTVAKRNNLKYTPIKHTEYKKTLEKFYDTYKDSLHKGKEKSRVRHGYADFYRDVMKEDISIAGMSLSDLRDIYADALDKYGKQRTRGDSLEFFGKVAEAWEQWHREHNKKG